MEKKYPMDDQQGTLCALGNDTAKQCPAVKDAYARGYALAANRIIWQMDRINAHQQVVDLHNEDICRALMFIRSVILGSIDEPSEEGRPKEKVKL